jgi:hypothetical protein
VVLLVAAAIVDAITIGLVLWKILNGAARLKVDSQLSQRPALYLLQIKQLDTQNAIEIFRRYPTEILVHSLVTLSLLAVVGMEFYFFRVFFTDGLIDFKGWGVGQMVGITIWLSVFTELGYLEFSQSYHSFLSSV